MPFDRYIQPSRQHFADQFDETASGLVYRKNQRRAPVPVSGQERDEAIDTFVRFLRRSFWMLLAAIMSVLSLAVGVSVGWSEQSLSWIIYPGMAIVSVCYMAAMHGAWNAPARRFATRSPIGFERSRVEARRSVLQKTSWRQLLGSMAAVVAVVASHAVKPGGLAGWNLLWLVGGGLALVLGGWRAIQKKRDEGDAVR